MYGTVHIYMYIRYVFVCGASDCNIASDMSCPSAAYYDISTAVRQTIPHIAVKILISKGHSFRGFYLHIPPLPPPA